MNNTYWPDENETLPGGIPARIEWKAIGDHQVGMSMFLQTYIAALETGQLIQTICVNTANEGETQMISASLVFIPNSPRSEL